MSKAIQILVLATLLGAFVYFSTAKAQQICTQTCEWIGDQWVCTVICY